MTEENEKFSNGKFNVSKEILESRKPGHEIDPLILSRWSARAMSGEGITDEELMRLFEAARWAPSSANTQPWRFIYAKREDKENFERLYNLLKGNNLRWNKNAAALALVITKKYDDEKERELSKAEFDAGCAFENLALQATAMKLVAHPMGGYDNERAVSDLNIPNNYKTIAMIGIGKPANPDVLDEDLRAREVPSQRKPAEEIIMKGIFDSEKA